MELGDGWFDTSRKKKTPNSGTMKERGPIQGEEGQMGREMSGTPKGGRTDHGGGGEADPKYSTPMRGGTVLWTTDVMGLEEGGLIPETPPTSNIFAGKTIARTPPPMRTGQDQGKESGDKPKMEGKEMKRVTGRADMSPQVSLIRLSGGRSNYRPRSSSATRVEDAPGKRRGGTENMLHKFTVPLIPQQRMMVQTLPGADAGREGPETKAGRLLADVATLLGGLTKGCADLAEAVTSGSSKKGLLTFANEVAMGCEKVAASIAEVIATQSI